METGKQESEAKGQERWRNGRRLPVGGLVLGFAIGLTGAPRSGVATRHAARPSLTFTVRLYNHARLTRDVLSSAERETDSLFRSAGVEIAWIDCPVSGEQPDIYRACQASFTPADFIIRIISADMAAKYVWPRTRMGYAIADCTAGRTGCWAAVSYRRVEDLALKADVSPALVLGKAMAHELGHLLLGPGHSDTGIMREELDDGDFGPGRLPSLVFLVSQRERLRAALAAVQTRVSAAR
jgi:hypothetical protein